MSHQHPTMENKRWRWTQMMNHKQVKYDVYFVCTLPWI